MSVRMMTEVFSASRSKLADRLVLLAIADCANDEGVAWPGLAKIAEKACISIRTAQRCLRNLEELGELRIDAQAGPYTVNRYQILPLTGGDKLSPHNTAGVSPVSPGGCHSCHQGGDSGVTGGVTAVSPNPSEEPSEEPSRESSDPPVSPQDRRSDSRNQARRCSWPADFHLTPPRLAYARSKGLAQPELEWEQFHDDALKKAKRWADWDAAWRNWVLLGVKRFGPRGQPAGGPRGARTLTGGVSVMGKLLEEINEARRVS